MACEKFDNESRDFEEGIKKRSSNYTSPVFEDKSGIRSVAIGFFITSVVVDPIPIDGVT